VTARRVGPIASRWPDLPGRETWIAALLFTGLTIAFAYPLTFHPATLRFPTGPDGDLGWYLLAWDTHAFLHKPWAIFDANIYYPQRLTLAYSESMIGIALFAAPVIWLTGNLVLAANFVSILSSALCGLGTYVLARRLKMSIAAAAIAGIIFECAPPRFFRIGQIHLTSVQWIPFGLAALHAYFDSGGKRYLRLAAACVTLQALSSGHGAVFIALALLTFAAVRVGLGEPVRPVRWARDLGASGVLLLLPIALMFVPYLAVQREVGLKRGLGTWVPNYWAFLASPSHLHRRLLSLVTDVDVNAMAGSFLFPGYLALLLAAAAIFWRTRPSTSDGADSSDARNPGAGVALRIAILASVAFAAVLTALALVPVVGRPTVRLLDPRTVAVAWAAAAILGALALAMQNRPAIGDRRPVLLLTCAALGWILLSIARPLMGAGNGLVAEYFTNVAPVGVPARSFVGDVPSSASFNRRWDGGPPGQFSVRWRGFLTVGQSGSYSFATTSDDGSQLFVRNRLVVDNGGAHGPQTRSGTVDLERGSHPIVLTYSQFGAGAELTWAWSRGGRSFTPVPAWALSQRRVPYGTVLGARAADWATVGLGILVVIAAAWYVRRVFVNDRPVGQWLDARRRDPRVFYGLLTLVAFALALGPPYGAWRYVYWLPGLNLIRETSRFTLIVLLGLAILAGIGFDRMTRGRAMRTRRTLAMLIGVWLLAEYAAMPMAVRPADAEIPAIDRWLAGRPKPFAVAEVPVVMPGDPGGVEGRQAAYMVHSTAHWQKTVNGYSGWRTDLHHQLYAEMAAFPDETSIKSLSDLNVTYVVVHADSYPPAEWAAVEERLRRFSARLRLEHVEGSGRVYALQGTDK